mmetsp:Transcript_44571/g.113902  ORF Transcript_44571/g.113902 Transcript_44571/m.113902 type:complete len:224 (+) Transcript_44571:325-996(+)
MPGAQQHLQSARNLDDGRLDDRVLKVDVRRAVPRDAAVARELGVRCPHLPGLVAAASEPRAVRQCDHLVLGGAEEWPWRELARRPCRAFVQGAHHIRPPGLGVLPQLEEQHRLAGVRVMHEDRVPARLADQRVRHLPRLLGPGPILEAREPDARVALALPQAGKPRRQQLPGRHLHHSGRMLHARGAVRLVEHQVLCHDSVRTLQVGARRHGLRSLVLSRVDP